MAGLQAVGSPVAPKDLTLNERLNRAYGAISNELDTIERVLARVNGAGEQGAVATPPTPMYGLADIVGHFESQAKRLAELTQGIERIA